MTITTIPDDDLERLELLIKAIELASNIASVVIRQADGMALPEAVAGDAHDEDILGWLGEAERLAIDARATVREEMSALGTASLQRARDDAAEADYESMVRGFA